MKLFVFVSIFGFFENIVYGFSYVGFEVGLVTCYVGVLFMSGGFGC